MDPIILSDEDDPTTPFSLRSKKRRTEQPNPNPTVFLIDDDPTPQKQRVPSSTPSIVPDTPFSPLFDSEIAIVKCTRPSDSAPTNLSGISQMICLESDDELENSRIGNWNENGAREFSSHEEIAGNSTWTYHSTGYGSSPDRHVSCEDVTRAENSGDIPSNPTSSQVNNMSLEQEENPNEKNMSMEQEENPNEKSMSMEQEENPNERNMSMEQEENVDNMKNSKVSAKSRNKATGKTKMTKEERSRLMEEKKLLKEQEKLRKAAIKAEAAELKKIEKEKQKWEKGKFAMKYIVAEIDAKVVESGSIGGHLLTRFAEKGLTYHITSNPISGSILWSMRVPESISQLSTERIEIPYVLLVYEADKFCNLTVNDSLFDQLNSIRNHYPAYTVCYLTNRLLSYINKREQEKYKNPENNTCWRRPPVEEVLAKLTTNFTKIHSRLCVDEAELAEHVVGLTCSLASCQFRKKLTRLSVNANGSLVSKDSVDRNLIKKSTWLKALVAIPKVQPRFAIAIWKKYPTMKSLLSVYMDPTKSEHEKEFLLKDLMTEGLIGGDRRLGEVCSKRVYRILMAQKGTIRTDDVENGADFFER
ncbi:crossover junction endonuclease EME1B-like isoform X1 [Vicia villosa]|uniref:crossover junction endonuclease EME1B-like isoform X1 n=1 Tax=Vicia villosa TaxID=3911 RepID=UPI00273B308B|nr:crossover junction endonuclease EME1B-like isoform X1 [Vicia villosa]